MPPVDINMYVAFGEEQGGQQFNSALVTTRPETLGEITKAKRDGVRVATELLPLPVSERTR